MRSVNSTMAVILRRGIEKSLEISVLLGNSKLFPDVFSVNVNCSLRKTHYPGYFFGSFPQFYKIGYVNFSRCQARKPCCDVLGKRRGQFIDIGAYYGYEDILFARQPACRELLNIW